MKSWLERTGGARPTPLGAVLLGFLIAGIAWSLLDAPDEIRRYHADHRLETEGNWQEVAHYGRYTEGVAKLTQGVGDRARLDLGDQEQVSRVRLLLSTYDPGGRTGLVLRIGGSTGELSYGEEAAGLHFHEVHFDPPAVGDHLEIVVTELQQLAVLIDGIETISPAGDFDLRRLLGFMALLGLVAAGLELARRFTVTPQASAGRTYRSIDVLRGLGAGLVVLLHARGYSAQLELGSWPWLGQVARQGHYGVEIFYVVSAYTLTFSLSAALRRRSDAIIQTFWWRRIVRIVPAFYVTFFGCLLLSALLTIPPTGVDSKNAEEVFATYLTMSYVFDQPILKAPISHSVWWSISTEFQFYVVMPLLGLPLLAVLTGRRASSLAGRTLAALVVALAGIGLAVAGRLAFAGEPWLQCSLFQHIDAFGLGIATALPFALRGPASTFPRGNPAALHILAAAALALLIVAVGSSTEVGNHLGLPALVLPRRLPVLLACSLTIVLLRRAEDRGGFGERFLPGLRALGLLSFTVYLIHVPVMQFVARLPVPTWIGSFDATWLWVVCVSGFISLLGALVLHRTVEMPALTWSHSPKRGRGTRIGSSIYIAVVAVAVVVGILRN